MPKEVSFVAFGCLHVPLHNLEHVKRLVQAIKAKKPDYLVCTGDLFEAEAASVWAKGKEHDVLDEFIAGGEVLGEIANACPSASKVWLLGNHDANLTKNDERRVPKEFRRLCDWNRCKETGSIFTEWRQIPYRKASIGCFQLGQVVFYHGFDCGATSDDTEALQFNNYTGGAAHRLFIRSHTHRALPVTQCRKSAKIELPFYYANVGTLCEVEKMDYAQRLDTGKWGPGPLYGTCCIGRSCYPEIRWEVEELEIGK